MATREDMGSWMGGGPLDGAAARERLGLPAEGPGSLAGMGRRAVALCVDWLLCLAVSGGFFGGDPFVTLGVFAVENVLLVGTAGSTIGHRLLGLEVRAPGAAAGSPAQAGRHLPGLARAAVRTAALCLVIPAVLRDADGRSLHDRVAGTVVVRR